MTKRNVKAKEEKSQGYAIVRSIYYEPVPFSADFALKDPCIDSSTFGKEKEGSLTKIEFEGLLKKAAQPVVKKPDSRVS